MNFKVFPIDFLQYLDFPSIIEIRDLQINFNVVCLLFDFNGFYENFRNFITQIWI